MTAGEQLVLLDVEPVAPDSYPYEWYVRRYLPERKGQACRVTARGRGPGPRNLRVEFTDGFEVVTAWSSIRRRRQQDDDRAH